MRCINDEDLRALDRYSRFATDRHVRTSRTGWCVGFRPRHHGLGIHAAATDPGSTRCHSRRWRVLSATSRCGSSTSVRRSQPTRPSVPRPTPVTVSSPPKARRRSRCGRSRCDGRRLVGPDPPAAQRSVIRVVGAQRPEFDHRQRRRAAVDRRCPTWRLRIACMAAPTVRTRPR